MMSWLPLLLAFGLLVLAAAKPKEISKKAAKLKHVRDVAKKEHIDGKSVVKKSIGFPFGKSVGVAKKHKERRTSGCSDGSFSCISGGCVPNSSVCDGNHDCHDYSDEIGCEAYGCVPSHFHCPDTCIPQSWICDGDNDCGDNSDEIQEYCPNRCGLGNYRCHSGQCIPESWQCDGDNDCDDQSDEALCHGDCFEGFYQCPNDRSCIPASWLCDGDDDCDDGWDEYTYC